MRSISGLNRGLFLVPAVGAAVLAAAGSAQQRPPTRGPLVDVVVALDQPSLARASVAQPRLFAAGPRRRLSLRAPASLAYMRALDRAQDAFAHRIREAIPGARLSRRYSVVLDAIAVTVPAAEAERLASLPGVARVYPTVRYHALLDQSPTLIGAPQLWGANLETAGNGIKIGIIDDGVYQTHPFFNAAGFHMPPGFPKGQRKYTTAKVIVARAFPPPSPHWRYAARPFDPIYSDHATHVAGIAAGDYGVRSPLAGSRVSGVAPKAYIGNYKVLTVPTPSLGLDGNSREIAAGIEAAVRDGMDVINLSLGEPEIEPSRDLVVAAIDGAADAGVVPVVAAGNDFNDFGFGSIDSPGAAPKAITVGAVTNGRLIADFSSAGPTPISFQLKPDVSAPGVNIVSSIPQSPRWATFSGTSMAAPHVAGGAALLRQRHPSWTVAQLKSALVLTGTRVGTAGAEVSALREGGGLISLPAANQPLLFAEPSSVAFRLVRRRTSAERSVLLTDAGGGAGTWTVSLQQQRATKRVAIQLPAQVTVPGELSVRAVAGRRAPEEDLTGFIVLTHGGDRRRIPYWLRVTAPALARAPATVLRRPGLYRANTAHRSALVGSYRYPDDPTAVGADPDLPGPEQVFRLRLRRPATNFGVVVTSHRPGVEVTPRVVRDGDENRLTGYVGLPVNLNPYLSSFELPVPAAGAVLPTPGRYDIVFDTRSRTEAGRFKFRFWIDDTRPPRVRLLTRSVRSGEVLQFSVTDRGSGVDSSSLVARIDGQGRRPSYSWRSHRVMLGTVGLRPGRHRVFLQVSDFQEAKNMEDVVRILPNTRRFSATFSVR